MMQDHAAPDAKIFVASVSPQVRASLAATFGISEREAASIIDQFLSGPQGLRAGGRHRSGFTWVVDTNVMREVVQIAAAEEVRQSLMNPEPSTGESGRAIPQRPILSSACPGWICYAEKTHPFILPHLSQLKSPQALSGTFLKSILSRTLGVSPSQIWHLAIMPCFDKKLEASREELTDVSWRSAVESSGEPQSLVRDVDCVITTRELLTLALSRDVSLTTLPSGRLPPVHTPHFPDSIFDTFLFSQEAKRGQTPATGTSGGYLYNILTVFQSHNPGSQIVTQRGRNADVVEYSLVSANGETIIKAARYYGFRNIQNLVRKLKPARSSRLPGAKIGSSASAASHRLPSSRASGGSAASSSEYAYVEVMACPGGCTNGGGQIRIEDARAVGDSSTNDPSTTSTKPSPQEQRAWLAQVDEAYYSAESDSEVESTHRSDLSSIQAREAYVREVLHHWSELTGIPLSKLLYTTYRQVESDVGRKKDVANDTARVVELAGKIGGGW